jgi:hypothetical protein
LVGSAEPDLVNKHIALDVQYACVYWISHFEGVLQTGFDQSFLELAYIFLKEHILHMFEVLSLLRKMDAAVSMMWSLRAMCRDSGHEGLAELAGEAYKFSVTHRYIIEQTPLQA